MARKSNILNGTKAMKGEKASVATKSIYEKWEETAKKICGPNAKLVLFESEAKLKIHEYLLECFAPKNIEDLYRGLGGKIPPPLLKKCLNDMRIKKHSENQIQNVDEDDDDDFIITAKHSPKLAQDKFSNTVQLRFGKNSNSTLYYANQDKIEKDRLDNHQSNQLKSKITQSKAKIKHMQKSLLDIQEQMRIILDQPTNGEISQLFQDLDTQLENCFVDLEKARKNRNNENKRIRVQKSLQRMIACWKARKRMCIDFLLMMEESTEGVIDTKNCLRGKGKIDVESDDSAIENERSYTMSKKIRIKIKKQKITEHDHSDQSRTNFFGVRLDKFGKVVRVIE